MSASPYREPGSTSSHVRRWHGQRPLNGAFNLVVVLAVAVLALVVFKNRGRTIPRLTLADPKSPRLLDLAVVGTPSPEPMPKQSDLTKRQTDDVEQVLHPYMAEAKRECWEASGGVGGATNASVIVHAQIERSGVVSGVEVEGDNVAVGSCLGRKVKSWVFYPSADARVVDFKFFGQ